MNKFWISWYCPFSEMGKLELHSPWWISGESETAYIVCAALIAQSDDDAEQQIYSCYDLRPESIEFRFVNQRGDDWSPFSERFPRSAWMKWPSA